MEKKKNLIALWAPLKKIGTFQSHSSGKNLQLFSLWSQFGRKPIWGHESKTKMTHNYLWVARNRVVQFNINFKYDILCIYVRRFAIANTFLFIWRIFGTMWTLRHVIFFFTYFMYFRSTVCRSAANEKKKIRARTYVYFFPCVYFVLNLLYFFLHSSLDQFDILFSLNIICINAYTATAAVVAVDVVIVVVVFANK